jgi:MSHA biogenesis protein MshI
MIRQFLSRLRSSAATTPTTLVSIVLQAERIKVLWLQPYPLVVTKVSTVVVADPSEWAAQLHKLVAEIPSKAPVCVVLPASHYQLYLVDRPNVADSELAAALPFLVAEQLTQPVSEMLLDYFQLPDVGRQAGALQVVAAEKHWLAPICKVLQRQDIDLQNIQPEEWLVRNLVLSQGAPQLVLSQQPGQELAVLILQQGKVYFSRKLRGYNRLAQYDLDDLQNGVLENLMLEIQRSMDYFEGQLRQPPIRDIQLLLPDHVNAALIPFLQQNGFEQVRAINLSGMMAHLTEEERGDYWLALAGALELVAEESDEAAR